MDGELENEEQEVKIDTERVVTADSSNKEDIFPTPVSGHEGIPAEMVASDHDEENSKSLKDTEDYPVEENEPEQIGGNELSTVNNIITSEDLAVRINEVNGLSMAHEESVVFEIDCNDDNGPPRLHLETPDRENSSPTREEEGEPEEEEPTAGPADKEDISYKEHIRLLQELCEERDKASQHSSQLQMELADYFCKKARDDTQLERELPVSVQLQEYKKHMNILTDLKKQFISESENAEQQAEQLSLQSQEKLDKVENEWRAFVALKQDVTVRELSRHLGKKAAQAKVESILAAEQLRQDDLIKLCLENIKMTFRIHSLEAKLREGEEQAKDPLQLQFERLQAERLDLKKHAEKQNEESLKMQKKISSRLELLSNIKEKLFWSQMEVQAKRDQLAELEATVARKRDLLTRTKQARNSMQRDNLRLREQRGLLGNRVLMRDFDDTVDASDHLEEQLENLKDQQADIMFRCGRWKKKLETT